MFCDILYSASVFGIILLIFIVAFGLGFHILFINHLAFDTPSWALLKTYVMMIGEFEFEGIFTEHDDPSKNETENAEMAKNIPFPDYSSLLFVIFVFIMSIIITNLLVGLAVDDIKEIQDNAELEKLSMNVQLVLESERFLPHIKCFLSNNYLYNYMKSSEVLETIQSSCWCVKDILHKERIVEFLSERTMGSNNDHIDKVKQKQMEIEKKLNLLAGHLQELMEDNKKILHQLNKS